MAVPIGAVTPRPMVIATHGNFDEPEWQCEVWSKVFRARVFVLCPRGVPAQGSPQKDPRFTYTDNRSLEKEVDADVAALRASPFAAYLAEGPPLYAGFSLGAIMGVAIAYRRAPDYPSYILVEGGIDHFDAGVSRAFAKNGGQRVMLVCAQGGCAGPARTLAKHLTSLGVQAVVVDAGQVGHTYDGAVAEAVAKAVPEFLAGDPRFADVFD